MTKFLGDGTFGRVFQAEYNGSFYAIKVIRAVKKYSISAKIEEKILEEIRDRSKRTKTESYCVNLINTFELDLKSEKIFCMGFEPLGKSLF